MIDERYDGAVPSFDADLRALPGVGEYTAAAVRAFAFGQRVAVLDTNVRRVLGRVSAGRALPALSLTGSERELAVALLPDDPDDAAAWGVAAMELGALVCTVRNPACASCPVAALCSWRAAGYPDPPRRSRVQTYAGTDRQCRGRILAVLRDAPGAVDAGAVVAAWDEPLQRERALASLLDDGLVVRVGEGSLSLP